MKASGTGDKKGWMTRGKIKLWVLLACAVSLALLLTMLVRRSAGELVTIRIEDRAGNPITNAILRIRERWTSIPLQKLNIRGVNEWHRYDFLNVSGPISIRIPKAHWFYTFVDVSAAGYQPLHLSIGDQGSIAQNGGSNVVFISLWREHVDRH